MKRTERAALWARRVRGWEASGLTQKAFCERERLAYYTFKRWVRMVRAEGVGKTATKAFVPVRVVAAPRNEELNVAPFEIRLRADRSIVLRGEFEERRLGRLIRLLEALPC